MRISQVYAEEASRVFVDKDGARDELPSVRFERDKELNKYVRARLRPDVTGDDGAELLKMVECSELMLASCAWFWEDIARIETVQMLRFAARAIELARSVGAPDLEPEFRHHLERAVPNNPRFRTGAELYDRMVKRSSPWN
jgi:hypothetical protein